MLKKSLCTPSHEAVLIRKGFEKNIRLDGRRLLDWRDTQLKLSRDESRSEADVTIGDTRVLVIVTGEIVKPFPDRPTEGMLQFSADMCLAAEHAGFNQSVICRLVERSIKDNECIDLESLTLVAGEQVWCICCDIRVLSFHGNLIDTTNLAVMSALRAFRKPEVSISLSEDVEASTQQSYTTRNLKLYSGDEREPLPLALHHTPLSVSIGLFRLQKETAIQKEDSLDLSKKFPHGIIFVTDPSREEEQAMDGHITFSVNSHSEISSIIMPGGTGLSVSAMMLASDLALDKAKALHASLVQALQVLEAEQENAQAERLEVLRRLREAQGRYNQGLASSSDSGGGISTVVSQGDGGLNLNDPILRYDYTHVTTGCTVAK